MTTEPTERATPSGDLSRDLPPWRRYASLLGAVFLGGVFLVAAWAKSLDPAAFADEIRNQGLDFLLSGETVALIALALEFCLGTALVLGVRRRWVLWPTAALVAFFVFLTGRTWYLDSQGLLPEAAGCGCFGNLVQRTPAQAFWQDLLLMIPALLLAFLAVGRGLPRLRLAVVALVTLAGTVFAWKSPDLPLDDLATQLKPGARIQDFCAGSAEDGTQTCMNAILPKTEGRYVIVLADLEDPAFLGGVEALNELVWTEGAPELWVLASAETEDLFQFRFTHGASFDVLETPEPIMSPLYRKLPRSFLIDDGVVVETWNGLPPLAELTGSAP